MCRPRKRSHPASELRRIARSFNVLGFDTMWRIHFIRNSPNATIGGRNVALFHYPLGTNSIKPSLLFSIFYLFYILINRCFRLLINKLCISDKSEMKALQTLQISGHCGQHVTFLKLWSKVRKLMLVRGCHSVKNDIGSFLSQFCSGQYQCGYKISLKHQFVLKILSKISNLVSSRVIKIILKPG